MTNDDLFWLAGLLEGEGSFMHGPPSAPNTPRISINMTDEDIIARVAALFDVKYHHVRLTPYGVERGWKPSFVCTITGKRAIELMKILSPLMGNRRKSKIYEIISSLNPPYRKLSISDRKQIVFEFINNSLTRKELASKWGINYSYCCRIVRKGVASGSNRNLQEPHS